MLLPNRLDSGGLKAAVASDQWQAEVEGSRGDETVGHVGNNVARDFLERLGHVGVHRSDEQSGVWISKGRTKPVKSGRWKPSPLNQIDRFDEGYGRYVHVARVADCVFNSCPSNS